MDASWPPVFKLLPMGNCYGRLEPHVHADFQTETPIHTHNAAAHSRREQPVGNKSLPAVLTEESPETAHSDSAASPYHKRFKNSAGEDASFGIAARSDSYDTFCSACSFLSAVSLARGMPVDLRERFRRHAQRYYGVCLEAFFYYEKQCFLILLSRSGSSVI